MIIEIMKGVSKKKKSKKTDKLSTTIDTAHKDIIIQTIRLLDLENNGMSLLEYIIKKEEEIQQKEESEKKEIKFSVSRQRWLALFRKKA